jgi:hypothetical protein
MTEAHRETQDIAKTFAPHQGGREKLVRRPFYKLDDADVVATVNRWQESLNDQIRDAN